MFIPFVQGATALTNSVADSAVSPPSVADSPATNSPATDACSPPPPGNNNPGNNDPNNYETVRHMLFGPLSVVRFTIRLLHKCGYAEPNDWSQPISTGRANEVMAILTKRMML